MISKSIFKIESTIDTNKLFHVLLKVPIINNMISPHVYSNYKLKNIFRIITTILSIIKSIMIKQLFFIVITVVIKLNWIPFLNANIAFMIFVILKLSLSLINPVIISDHSNKWLLIKTFKMNNHEYYLNEIFQTLFNQALFALLILVNKGDLNVYEVLFLMTLSVTSIPIHEAYSLRKFEKNHLIEPYYKRFISSLILGLIQISIAFVSSLYKPTLFIFIVILLLLMSFKAIQEIRQNTIIFDIHNYQLQNMQLSSDIERRQMEMHQEAVRSDSTYKESTHIIEKRKGYQLLNALFFDRHTRIWKKPIINTSKMILVVGTVSTLALTLIKTQKIELHTELVYNINQNPLILVALALFILNFLNVGDLINRAFFLNCDTYLLNYAFYRKKESVWIQYVSRMKQMILSNLIPTTIMLLFLIFLNITKLMVVTLDNMITISTLLLATTVLVSVYHLFLYFIFQPFSSNLTVKSLPYSLLSGMIYYFTFNFYRLIDVPNLKIIILSITILFMVLSTIAIRLIGHRTFRIRK